MATELEYESEQDPELVTYIMVSGTSEKLMMAEKISKPNGMINFSAKFVFTSYAKKNPILILKINYSGEADWKINDNIHLSKKLVEEAKARALRAYFDIDTIAPLAWPQTGEIPLEVLDGIKSKIEQNCQKVISNHRSKTENELVGLLGDNFTIEYENKSTGTKWQVNMRGVSMSSASKEPITGADIAILLHYKGPSGIVGIKTIWLQAKRTNKSVKEISDLRELDENLEQQCWQMKQVTQYSYPIIFARDGVFLSKDLSNSSDGARMNFPDFLKEAADCQYGDKRSNVFVESSSITHIYGLGISELDELDFLHKKKQSKNANSSKFDYVKSLFQKILRGEVGPK
jgi:hypothetical protein